MAEVINLSVIGLGLMGGSIAKALRHNLKYRVTAYDSDVAVLEKAWEKDTVHAYTDNAITAVKGADLVAVCLYPKAAVDFILRNMESFKHGAVVTDICGVKRLVTDEVTPHLRRDVSFVPGHPMAGREKKGFSQSDGELFRGCNYLVVADEGSLDPAVALVKDFALDLGAGRVVCTQADRHDAYIAYTSQLPHAISCAYVKRMEGRPLLDYAAGSLKDVSRVADINAAMWSELFLENADNLADECEKLASELERIAGHIKKGEKKELEAYMLSCAAAMEKRDG